MSDHIDHLLVANLYHVVLVDLESEEERKVRFRVITTQSSMVYSSVFC